MIFVLNNLKYDTDKMVLISDKCEYSYTSFIFTDLCKIRGKNVKLYKSTKGRWLLTYIKDHDTVCGRAMTEKEVKDMLLVYDIEAYEKEFGELEEA